MEHLAETIKLNEMKEETTQWEERFSDQFSPMIMNDTVCGDCGTDFVALKGFISQEIERARSEGYDRGREKGNDEARELRIDAIEKAREEGRQEGCNSGFHSNVLFDGKCRLCNAPVLESAKEDAIRQAELQRILGIIDEIGYEGNILYIPIEELKNKLSN